MSTIPLDESVKHKIIADINHFWSHVALERYSNCGIPYHRGYLLYGLSGTEKSSFSFTIAGMFKVDVYCISLNDSGLTDGELLHLFFSLPRHCVLLLEDINSANIHQRNVNGNDSHEKKNNQGISLSGLLNAIDGVASLEGRILIIIINFPENLDSALVRPDRIDHKVEFKLASKQESHKMFLQLYSYQKANEVLDNSV